MANRSLVGALKRPGPGRPGLLGIDKVMRNLQLQIVKMEVKAVGGLIMGAAIIRRDMDVTPPLIPVDTGVLRASWYTKHQRKPRPEVEMGFKAPYAIFVHELKWKQGKRPGSGPKFFEYSVKRNKKKVLAAIALSIKQK